MTLHLCATTRLAQVLRGERPSIAGPRPPSLEQPQGSLFDDAPVEPRAAGGKQVWRTPAALTVGQWLAELADEALLTGLAELPTALEPYAERVLWEKVVADSLNGAATLFDLPGMAATAADAHALCRVWNLVPGGDMLSDEARLFLGWQAEFEKRCREAGWLDAAGVQRQVIALIEAGHFALPQRVRFLGFDRYTPFERRLMAALEARGVEVENSPEFPVDRSTVTMAACADRAAECAAVADWAQRRLAEDPDCRLGIIAPDLAGVRDRLEFLLDDLLHPALIRPDGAEAPRRFNFSLGRPLAELPLIRAGLDLLAVAASRAKVEQARLSALLLAPGWAASEGEADGRAQLDAAMRRDLAYFTTPNALVRLAGRLAGESEGPCPQTVAALADLAEIFAAAAGRRKPSAWSGIFRRALAAAGWPGDRSLSSNEFQARRAFVETLDAFGQLDALFGPLTAPEAVRRLRELARQRLFQPETRGRPNVQVLGVLESAGLEFDALWVMGMNDDQWPPAPRPNPLLPAELLRSANASHASAEVELDFARRVHQRLLHSAPQIRFSWAQADGNRVLRPSPLLAGLPEVSTATVLPLTLARRLADAAGSLERVDDALAPPVAEGETVRGGSWLLRAQAICPAWAFYEHRLAAKAIETPVEGLDPRARGTLVHAALEAFWKAVVTSERLAALSDEGRRQAIAEAVRAGLDDYEQNRRVQLPARFRELESARLARLLEIWLAIEAARETAFEVVACEKDVDVSVQGIRVKMVVDRIDRLADDRQVVIDYKTGQSIDVKNWASDRLTEPQLPIYAALTGQDIAAVAFAKVLLDDPCFAGVADASGTLPGVRGLDDDKQKLFDPARFADWDAVVAHWRERLQAVADEVKAGVAGVVFADEKQLQHCPVRPLLRLPERRRLLGEEA